jgi:hypothetical protein
MAARLSRRAAVLAGLATGVNSQTTGYLAGESFTVHASTPSSFRSREGNANTGGADLPGTLFGPEGASPRSRTTEPLV